MDKELLYIESGNIIIYQSDISMIESEYIDSLMKPDMIYKSSCFNGLLNLIYERYLKNFIKRDNHIDYELCDSIFNSIYIPLCGKYDMVPTTLQFVTILLHISYDNIMDIKLGMYRGKGIEVTKEHTNIIKKWFRVTESSMLGKAVNDNGIGAIFGLKALYGYSDSNPIRLEVSRIEEHETPEQIAERHKAAFLPEKPDF